MPRRDEYDDRDPYGDRYEDRPHGRGDGPDADDQAYDEYDDGPRRGQDAARKRVLLPAIFLMIVGGLGLGLGLLNVVLEAAGVGGPNPFVDPKQANDPQFQQIEKVTKVVGPILNITWGLIVFFGGLQLKNLKSRGFVIFSCIWAMLPCNGCCLLGIPFGIWALVVVNDESVKRSF